MSRNKIDTEAISATAGNLRRYNTQIRDSLPSVRNAIDRMDGAWDGKAANMAVISFRNIVNTYNSARYRALENYATLLTTHVGQGYEETETKNQSLADRFK